MLHRQATQAALFTQWHGLTVPVQALKVIGHVGSRGRLVSAVQLAKGLDRRRSANRQHEIDKVTPILQRFGEEASVGPDFLKQNLPAVTSLGLSPCP